METPPGIRVIRQDTLLFSFQDITGKAAAEVGLSLYLPYLTGHLD